MINYELILRGWLYQLPTDNIQKYDFDYVSRYNLFDDTLQRLRYDYCSSYFNFDSVLDVGYGNGDFLKVCKENGKECYGNDISGYALPEGIHFTEDRNIEVDLVTFFDCLEHFPERNLEDILSSLRCKYLCITVPWCHDWDNTDKFLSWRHRKPNEHFHHFDVKGLSTLLNMSGFDIVNVSSFEDTIRSNKGQLPNILTVLAKKSC
jgi:SAM-dependent methyltransferase